VTGQAAGRKRIIYDGLNLAPTQGTGIATYARVLAHVAHDIGRANSIPEALLA
jgi:hypothetical protein